MPTLTIDDKPCRYEGNKTILQVALENGVEIPHYCYHPGLSVVASCRICLAEVEQPNPRDKKLELIPRLMPACQTMASDGQVVHTRTPKAVANQKAVMEYLLINHPLDCPVCDQAGECHLQDYSFKYGRAESRFEEDKIKQPVKDIGPHVKLYSDRCIMCSRCVRFTKEVTGTGELGVFGRGSGEQIDVFPGRPLDNPLSGNVVDICPVGALLDKDFLFERRVWELSSTASIDGLTASGDNLSVHHADGRVYRVKPRFNPLVNRWWISDEVRYGWKFSQREDRLRQPLRSVQGDRSPSAWPAAIREAADLLREGVAQGGPGSLAFLASPMIASEEAYLLARVILSLDPRASLAVGPVPVQGEDKVFPGGFQLHAEKAPNARGVRRALMIAAGVGAQVASAQEFQAQLEAKGTPVRAALITGNYPSEWPTQDLVKALGKRPVVLLDTLPNSLSAGCSVLLPAATWLEKSGSFVNARGMIQAFRRAVPGPEGVRAEGQVALDLGMALGRGAASAYDAGAVRREMGEPFAGVVEPVDVAEVEPDMQYVEL
jgi:NADH-quinone oxidoreductase subunit G